MKRAKSPAAEAVSRAVKLLGYRDRSEAELRERLLRKGFLESDVETAVEQLKSAGFIDDRRFAEALHRYATATKHLGTRGVRAFMLRRGVPVDVVDEMTGAAPEDPEVAAALVRRRMNAMVGLSSETVRRRLRGLLMRRGFSSDTIDKVLKSSVCEEGGQC